MNKIIIIIGLLIILILSGCNIDEVSAGNRESHLKCQNICLENGMQYKNADNLYCLCKKLFKLEK